jgi:transposase
VRDVNEIVAVVFSGLSAPVIEGVTGEDEVIRVSARTRGDPVPCPACGTRTARVHGFHGRVLADVPVDGRRIVVWVRVRRLVCLVLDCPQQTFREQVPGVVERYQRRTNRLTNQLNSVGGELAGRAGAHLCRVLACAISRSTALRMPMRRAVTPPLRVPRVIGVDDFVLKRRHRYATVIIDAETGERIDVLPDRTAQTLTTWLREHPGAQYVCRDGSATGRAVVVEAILPLLLLTGIVDREPGGAVNAATPGECGRDGLGSGRVETAGRRSQGVAMPVPT